ncbi:MAG: S-layer homology domain-containing protein [Oscillibacter sp.]|nr:S-layer homology domain-containing protein [Oscillibacter sp.]
MRHNRSRKGGHLQRRLPALVLAALMGLSLAVPALALPPTRDDPIEYEDPTPVNPDNPEDPDNPGGSGGSGGSTPEEPDPGTDVPEESGVVVLSAVQATINVSASVTLMGVPSPETGVVRWSTDRPDIVKLSNTRGTDCTVQGVSPGVAYVSARVGSGTPAVCVVTVSGVTLNTTELELEVNHAEGLRYQVYGDAENVVNWDWGTSNSTVANVIPQGTQDPNSAIIQALEQGSSLISVRGGGYTAHCQVTVTRKKVEVIKGTLSGGVMKFSTLVSAFQERCVSVTGDELRYVTGLVVLTDPGTLYDGYVSEADTGLGVAKNQDYYVTGGAYLLNNLSFVPRATTSGTVEINYVGVAVTGKTFVGVIEVEVTQQQANLSYSSLNGSAVRFRSDDFITYAMSITNRTLQYVTFALPKSEQGTLYYNYTSPEVFERTVQADTRYYMTTSPTLNNVYFVPKTGFTGDLTIAFTGRDTEGRSITGNVRITVTDLTDSKSSSDAFTVASGERVSLRNGDFTVDDRIPDYVVFDSLPAASRGTLYYQRTTPVETGTRYYRTSSGSRPLLRELSFVAGSWSGTVTIPFTGYDGESFEGKLVFKLTGSSGGSSGSNATYTSTGPAVRLQSTDFTDKAKGELDEVATVRLTNPPATAGRLLRNFISPGSYEAFNTAQDYSPEVLNQVYFLPRAEYSGSTTMTYTVKDRKGKAYSSTVTIQVTPPETSRYFSDLAGRSWAVPAVDFFRTYGILKGATPTTYDPDAPARRGQFIAVMGRMYSFPSYPLETATFADITNPDMYYTPYVTAARILGIVDQTEYFYPDAPITRQDAAVYLYRSMKRAGVAQEGDDSDLEQFTDLSRLAPSARQAMASMVRLGVFQGDQEGRLNPTGALSRLQMAAILYRAVTGVATSGLAAAAGTGQSDSLYTVSAKDAAYVVDSVQAMFHDPKCAELKSIPASHLQYVGNARDTVLNAGFRPCPVCNPA